MLNQRGFDEDAVFVHRAKLLDPGSAPQMKRELPQERDGRGRCKRMVTHRDRASLLIPAQSPPSKFGTMNTAKWQPGWKAAQKMKIKMAARVTVARTPPKYLPNPDRCYRQRAPFAYGKDRKPYRATNVWKALCPAVASNASRPTSKYH